MRTEDDIRAAYESLARRAPDAATVLAAVTQPAAASQRRSRRRLLVPLAAATAVIAAIGVLLAVGSIGGPAARGRSLAANAPGPGGAPRYYMVLAPSSKNIFFPLHADIRDTASGAVLARVYPPAGFNTIRAVAGAANDRTFVIAAQDAKPVKGVPPTTFFRAQFDPGRRAVTLTRLPIPMLRGGEPAGLALSPNGAKLAVASIVDGVTVTTIDVYSMSTGAGKLWHQRTTIGATMLSFDRAGQLAYTSQDGRRNGVWLLDTATPPGGLFADSRLVVRETRDWGLYQGGLLTANGRTVVGGKFLEPIAGRGSALAEFSVATGKLTRLMHPSPLEPEWVFWTNANGSVLVASVPGKTVNSPNVYGVQHGRAFTRIPRLESDGIITAFPFIAF